jgi:uncharacterized phage protein gp47/JayE
MPFKIPSLSDTREFLLAVGKALFPDRNFDNVRSYHGRRTTYLSAGITQLHSHIQKAQNDAMPDTASDDGPIDRWGGIVGVVRKGATPARKSAAGRVRGAFGMSVIVGSELVHESSGLRFQIANGTTIPAALFIDVDIVGIDTGVQTRLLKGVTLKFVDTPAGLETDVVLQKDLDEDGFDSEQFGAYRARVLSAFASPSAGGSASDYVRWALEVSGVSAAYCYPNRAGVGTVDVVGLHTGTGSSRILLSGEVAELLAYLKTKAPAHIAGTLGALRVLTVVADAQNVEILVTSDGLAANSFDWTGAPLTVLAYTAGSRLVQFNAARPSTMKAGHRIVFKGVASSQDGQEFTIEALSSTDSVILQSAPVVNLAATDLAYSGGPLVTPIRSAIVAHMNGERVYAAKGRIPTAESALESTVGLEVIADGIGPANPAGVYGAWSGGLIRAVLTQIALYKSGVRNVSITTPAADYEATDDAYPNDANIHMIIPGNVLVRSA